MDPRTLGQRFAGTVVLLTLAAAPGCGGAYSREEGEPPDEPARAAGRFDPATAASLRGRVTWEGALPVVPLFTIRPNLLAGPVLRLEHRRLNPNAPTIDAATRGLANAVVFLRGVDPRRGKPWDQPPVRVEQHDCQFHILQGPTDSRVGFVRRGDPIAMISRDRFFHALHAGGAAFFSFTFPDPEQPLRRRLPDSGLVELTSAAGYYWMRAYLFVDEQPYFTRTDAAGHFTLTQVPPGHCELVCWLPNWNEARHERDPESGLITRMVFQQPIEQVQALTLEPRETRETTFHLAAPPAGPHP